MGKDKDFSVFIKSGHVLYCSFVCCLIPFENIQEKTAISHSTVYLLNDRLSCQRVVRYKH